MGVCMCWRMKKMGMDLKVIYQNTASICTYQVCVSVCVGGWVCTCECVCG